MGKKKISCEKKLRLSERAFPPAKVTQNLLALTMQVSVHLQTYISTCSHAHLHGCIRSPTFEKVLSRKTSSLSLMLILMRIAYQFTLYESSYHYFLPCAELAHRISTPRSAASTAGKRLVPHTGQQKNWYSG